MTLLDYISFMEDRSNIDTYVLVKKEKTIVSQEEYAEDVTLEDGTVEHQVKTRPVETTTTEIYKCTFLENGGIKKELCTPELLQAKLDAKQAEVSQIESDISVIKGL